MAVRRQLQQVDAIDEAMKARALGVERDRTGIGDVGEKAIDGLDGVELERSGCGLIGHGFA
jgi:hypothetical protein